MSTSKEAIAQLITSVLESNSVSILDLGSFLEIKNRDNTSLLPIRKSVTSVRNTTTFR